MTMGQICFAHEFCTNCPVRRECTVLPLFYSDTAYNNWREEVIQQTVQAARHNGMPEIAIIPGISKGISMMDKRRARELQENKTYKP